MAIFEERKWRIHDIITGDESWVYHRNIGTKSSNRCWVADGEVPTPIVRRNRFEPKSMIVVFFKTTGPVVVDVVDKGKTVDNKYYIDRCLIPVVQEINRQRPNSSTTFTKP